MNATLAAPTDRSTPVRPLLLAGAAAGPLFVAAVLAQAYVRPGFDPARHPLSSLALGDLGWLQIANFLIYCGLTLTGAVGLQRALGRSRGATWGPRLIALSGVGFIVAGIFPADPINGFPAGTDDVVTWHGAVHSAAGAALAGIAGLVAYGVFARRFAADREWRWVVWTTVTPILVLASSATAAATTDFRPMLMGQAIGAAWITSLFLKHLAHREATTLSR